VLRDSRSRGQSARLAARDLAADRADVSGGQRCARGRSGPGGTTSTASRASRTSCSPASTRSIRTRRLEAFAAGLRPAPILSLIRGLGCFVSGLALRRDQRTASVAALADLGVTGRERLHRASEADRAPRRAPRRGDPSGSRR
jgi:hypothetical protein